MHKPVIILDPGHGGLTSFFYDLDNGVRLPYTWEEVRNLDPSEKVYLSKTSHRRWQAGELPVEPRFYFEHKGRRVTYGDPGDVSPLDPRICEKDLVLDLARSMHREIGRRLLVKSTRDRDGYVADSSRVAYANRVIEKFGTSTLFLSLHTESSSDPERRGIRLRPAQRLPSTLVEHFEVALVRHLRDLGEREARVEVDSPSSALTGLEMPSLTVVVGYLSNVADAQRLLERSLRQELARTLAHTAVRRLVQPDPVGESLEQPALVVPAVLSEGLA